MANKLFFSFSFFIILLTKLMSLMAGHPAIKLTKLMGKMVKSRSLIQILPVNWPAIWPLKW